MTTTNTATNMAPAPVSTSVRLVRGANAYLAGRRWTPTLGRNAINFAASRDLGITVQQWAWRSQPSYEAQLRAFEAAHGITR